MLFLTILRRIQAGIFESSVRRRQNRIGNLFICVNFDGVDRQMSFKHKRNGLFPVKGQMIDRIAQG